MLISCGEEQGNWTAVEQEGEYIYGVWHGTTAKNAERTMQTVAENLKNVSVLSPTEDVLQTTVSPEQLLPSGVELLGWVQSRTPSTYEGKTLYRDRTAARVLIRESDGTLRKTLYRDRAAAPDLYYAYGFQRQAEVEYETPRFGAKPLILLEIFDMGTPENAFGIYSFHTYPQMKFEWVGSKALLSGGYLRFSKGRYFVQIEGYEFATGIREGMVALAKAVAVQIQEPEPKPKVLALLPGKKMGGSVKLFRSNWVLRQIYSTLPVHVPQLTDMAFGISARYQERADSTNWMGAQIVFILRFPDTAAAESAYTLYRDAVMKETVPGDVILINEPLSTPQ